MTDTDFKQVDNILADNGTEPVKVKQEDYEQLLRIQSFVDALAKYRQEMGRLVQLIGNMREEANKVEVELATSRRSLSER